MCTCINKALPKTGAQQQRTSAGVLVICSFMECRPAVQVHQQRDTCSIERTAAEQKSAWRGRGGEQGSAAGRCGKRVVQKLCGKDAGQISVEARRRRLKSPLQQLRTRVFGFHAFSKQMRKAGSSSSACARTCARASPSKVRDECTEAVIAISVSWCSVNYANPVGAYLLQK